ncbi:MAG: Right handed beta helix region [Blastocatellia bacterium]|jgi:hypothetical protein|nr:Right handed beta helix region [Blastocatellia bacterium]
MRLKRKSARNWRILAFCFAATALLGGTSYVSSTKVSANHPVLVEGNCDSPVPSTTLVSPGTCGDFDGDGRIGTAEDTDGADRIFGTLAAALGPGTGAAAGTGANFNGSILIVSSGRFAEQLFIGQSGYVPALGTPNPGNVTIEAAPGVIADIDAVLQGDPAGGNAARQDAVGITVLYPPQFDSIVTLRNLTIRNWRFGLASVLNSKIIVDKCRFENNRDSGILIRDFSKVTVSNSTIDSNGHRIPVTGPPNPGDGITMDGGNSPQLRVTNSTFSHNFGAGIRTNFPAANVTLFGVSTYFNGTDIVGAVTIAPNPNYAN